MRSTADVIIIGAGVIGCSTAYHLTECGVCDVAVLEMGTLASGTTGKSASMFSLQFPEDTLLARMALAAYDRYRVFESELGVPIDYRPIGWIYLAGESSAKWLQEQAHTLISLGIETELLPLPELHRRCPELHLDDVSLASWGPQDGVIDAYMITSGYMRRARERGVRLHEGVRATRLLLRDGRIHGAITSEGPIHAPVVVNAAGPWAGQVGGWVDVTIPLRNATRTVVVTSETPQIARNHPFVEDLDAGWYFRPEGDGVLMAMGARPVVEPDVGLDGEMVQANIEAAMHRVPILRDVGLRTAWTGVRPLTPDGRPILGRVPHIEGFLLNCGWGGMGIIQAPVAGQVIAEAIAGGESPSFDLQPFSLKRFGS